MLLPVGSLERISRMQSPSAKENGLAALQCRSKGVYSSYWQKARGVRGIVKPVFNEFSSRSSGIEKN